MTVPARQCARFILILGCISAVPLAASADQASRLEEIIVTATKRESSLHGDISLHQRFRQ